MTRKFLAGLGAAGALTLWASVGSLAQNGTTGSDPSVAEATAIAAEATSSVNTCETDQVAAAQALEGQAVAAGKDPEAAKELADETAGQVQDIAADARDAIDSTLDDFVDQVGESADTEGADEQGVAESLAQFKTDVDAIAKAACDAMGQAVADAQAQIASLDNAQAAAENPQSQEPAEQPESSAASDQNGD